MPDAPNNPELQQAEAPLESEFAALPPMLPTPPPDPCVSAETMTRSLALLATQAWKLRQKMTAADGSVRDESKRLFRHVEAMYEVFSSLGLEIKDHTGDNFDYGLPVRVITAQPTPGLAQERVIETVKPTIYWQKKIIQVGEVVIATPA